MTLLLHLRYIFVASICLSVFCFALPVNSTTEKNVRLVTKEELEANNGKDGNKIWLSVMGEVYDVSKGKEHYGEGSAYSVFVGRDASVSFSTGKFTPEEAAKSLDGLDPQELLGVDEWNSFYKEEEKYPFVGLLIGNLYDKDGNPTEELARVKEKIEVGKVEAEKKKQERKEALKRRRLEKEKAEADKAKEKANEL